MQAFPLEDIQAKLFLVTFENASFIDVLT